jgi:hypothetical protein
MEDEEEKPPEQRNCMYWLDAVSSYPHAAMNTFYPVGPYEIFVGDTLTEQPVFNAESKKFFFQQKELIGLCHVRVIPPKDLLYPFLPYKAKDGKSYAPLCRTCTEAKRNGTCHHSDLCRSWVQTYTTLDLNYAAELGYQVIFFELMAYSKSAKIYADHVSTLAYYKIKNSGFGDDIKSQADKEKFCQELNEDMDFPTPLLPEDICYNAGQRYVIHIN